MRSLRGLLESGTIINLYLGCFHQPAPYLFLLLRKTNHGRIS